MQNFRFFLLVGSFAVLCAIQPHVRAQDDTATPAPDASSTGAASTDLFPNGGVQTPAPAQGGRQNGGRRNGGGGGRNRGNRRHDLLVSQADADPLVVRVDYRRAKTIALARDPGLAELLREADAAGTDVQRRVYLKEYYTRLFASIRKVDPSPEMKAHVALLSAVATQRYDPRRREVGGDEDLVNGRGRGRRGRVE